MLDAAMPKQFESASLSHTQNGNEPWHSVCECTSSDVQRVQCGADRHEGILARTTQTRPSRRRDRLQSGYDLRPLPLREKVRKLRKLRQRQGLASRRAHFFIERPSSPAGPGWKRVFMSGSEKNAARTAGRILVGKLANRLRELAIMIPEIRRRKAPHKGLQRPASKSASAFLARSSSHQLQYPARFSCPSDRKYPARTMW